MSDSVIDREYAEAQLASFLDAIEKISTRGVSYTIGGYTYTSANLGELRDQVSYWQRAVRQIAAAEDGARSPDVAIARFR